MGRVIPFRIKTNVEMFGEYMLEQSASARAVPEITVGEAGRLCGRRRRRSNVVPLLHTIGQTMLRCIRMLDLIKMYYSVQE